MSEATLAKHQASARKLSHIALGLMAIFTAFIVTQGIYLS